VCPVCLEGPDWEHFPVWNPSSGTIVKTRFTQGEICNQCVMGGSHIVVVPITENSVHVPGSSDMVMDAVSSAGAGVPMQETPPIAAPPTENVSIPSGDQMDVLTEDGTAEGPK
jgi:hypothetical protein